MSISVSKPPTCPTPTASNSQSPSSFTTSLATDKAVSFVKASASSYRHSSSSFSALMTLINAPFTSPKVLPSSCIETTKTISQTFGSTLSKLTSICSPESPSRSSREPKTASSLDIGRVSAIHLRLLPYTARSNGFSRFSEL